MGSAQSHHTATNTLQPTQPKGYHDSTRRPENWRSLTIWQKTSNTAWRYFNPSEKAYDKICVWSGPVAFLFFFLIFLAADLLPPIPPRATGEEITAHFKKHEKGLKAGAALMQFPGAFYSMFIAAISGQMSRIPGVSHSMLATQSIGGGISAYTITLPSIFFCIASYRLDRSPELMLLLSDMCWMITVIPFVTFVSSNFALSYAILLDKRPNPLFPHWFAWVSSIWPWGFVGGLALHVVYSGAFAWNGGFTFWTGAVSIGIGTALNVYFLLAAIDKTDEECERPANSISSVTEKDGSRESQTSVEKSQPSRGEAMITH